MVTRVSFPFSSEEGMLSKFKFKGVEYLHVGGSDLLVEDFYQHVCGSGYRLPTAPELISLRISVWYDIVANEPGGWRGMIRRLTDHSPLPESVRYILGSRITTSTYLVCTQNSEGTPAMFFVNGQLDRLGVDLTRMSDGGVPLQLVPQEGNTLNYNGGIGLRMSEYNQALGGRFSTETFRTHPVFRLLAASNEEWSRYVSVLDGLSMVTAEPRVHCGWLPRHMEIGYCRPITLGDKGEAVYPANLDRTCGFATVCKVK